MILYDDAERLGRPGAKSELADLELVSRHLRPKPSPGAAMPAVVARGLFLRW
jgi:hypothetical protein